jgi:imidazoleglycerol phosphate synthase glutamine amidotransferase subunit HisH
MEAFLSDKAYSTIKWAVVIVLPAIGTLYFALASIWGLPAAEQVMGTILALQAFLGIVLGISSKSYNASDAQYAGAINMSHTEKGLLYSLDLNGDPEDIQHQDKVIFKVNPPL